MAATTDSFRSSLHGFNRMDVVQFIQRTTSEHELELRRLAEERTRQQEELEQQKKELAARQEESERQKQELSQLRAELAELREQNAALRQAQEPAEQPTAAVQKPRYDDGLPPCRADRAHGARACRGLCRPDAQRVRAGRGKAQGQTAGHYRPVRSVPRGL